MNNRSPDQIVREEEGANLLGFIDTQNIEELDPMKVKGHRITLETDLPMIVKLKAIRKGLAHYIDDGEGAHVQMQSEELMHFKVLIMGDEDEPGTVHIELTSDEDIFFHYKCE